MTESTVTNLELNRTTPALRFLPRIISLLGSDPRPAGVTLEIIVPLSPTHLMYTKVGSHQFGNGTLSLEMTLAFQRLLAERAHRWIFARGQPKRAVWFRPRTVSLAAFTQEQQAWNTWHDQQRAAETGEGA